MSERHNVILVTIDSLRADHLGCYGYPVNTSPNIDNLARRGALFLNAISNGGGTPEAFPSILASVYPPVHHVLYREIIKSNITIAEVLKLSGYKTAAFHSNPYLSRYFFYHKGFDVFYDSLTDKQLQDLVRGLSGSRGRFRAFLSRLGFVASLIVKGRPPIVRAEELTRRGISWLKKCSTSKNFLWLHYMDVHHPYIPPQAYLKQIDCGYVHPYKMFFLNWKAYQNNCRLSDKELGELCHLYDASIKYVDDQVGKLIEELKKDGNFADTVIILTADHGDEWGEHGSLGHVALYNEVINIPLIITGPGIPEAAIEEQVCQMDIVPTLLDILGFKKRKEFYGESLRSLLAGNEGKSKEKGVISISLNYPLNQRICSYRTQKWKYIRIENFQTAEISHEFYDLENDPEEVKNLYNEYRAKEAALLEQQVLEFIFRSEKHYQDMARIRRRIEKLKGLRKI